MDVEFLPEQPDESPAPPDLPMPPRNRRRTLVLNGLLAAVLIAGGVGWFASRPSAHPAPATSPTASAVAVAPQPEDALYGCPNTLACDDNHQMQQHFINLIKQAMERQPVAVPPAHPAPLTHAARFGGLGRFFVLP